MSRKSGCRFSDKDMRKKKILERIRFLVIGMRSKGGRPGFPNGQAVLGHHGRMDAMDALVRTHTPNGIHGGRPPKMPATAGSP